MTDSADNSSDRPLRDEPTDELLLKFLVFSGMTRGLAQPAVKMAERVQKSIPLSERIISLAFRKGPGKIFFGGETLGEAENKSENLLGRGKGVILDYAAPENQTGLTEDHYLFDVPQQIRDTILACKRLKEKFPQSTVSLAIKVSTLADKEFLERVSAKLATREDLGKDKEPYEALRGRFERFIQLSNDVGVTPFVDAEETKINTLIRDLAFGAVDKGSKLSLTLQCYLQETDGIVDALVKRKTQEHKPVPDIKLVRGAYMGKGYEGELEHIWERGDPKTGKARTDKCYDESFEKLYGVVGSITAATHNQQSLDKIAEVVAEHTKATHVSAATLLGMGDGLKTSPGIEKIKYVPYGKEMHYFMRRGTEFAMNPVQDPSGKTVTRGRSERDLVISELKERHIPGLNLLLSVVAGEQKQEKAR